MITEERISKWQAELDKISITWRWGETRRFQSNSRTIDRRTWLIEHISAAKAKLAAQHRAQAQLASTPPTGGNNPHKETSR